MKKKEPIKYPITPPKIENIVVKKVIRKILFFFISAIGNKKRSVGIGKKMLSIKEIKYKSLRE